MPHKLAFLWLFVLALILPVPSTAGTYLFEYYSEHTGLPNNQVHAMAQDDQGVLWFATRVGIVSYDSHEWVLQGASQGLLETEYTNLVKGPHGKIWAAARGTPYVVQYLENGYWKEVPSVEFPFAVPKTCLLVVEEWVDGSIIIALANLNGDLAFLIHDQWHVIENTGQLEDMNGYSWWNNLLLVGTRDGLLAVDPQTLEITSGPIEGVPPGGVFALGSGPDEDDLWLVGRSWIGKASGPGATLEILANDLPLGVEQNWSSSNLLVTSGDGLFFGGVSQAYFYSQKRGLEALDTSIGRHFGGATQFFQDREGIFWITGLRGISKLISRRFSGYDRDQGLFKDEVTAVLETRDGRIVLGHEGGLTVLDPDPRPISFGMVDGQFCRVMSLTEDPQGDIWCTTDGQGIAIVQTDGEIRWLGPEDGVPKRVFDLLFGDDGKMYLGFNLGVMYGQPLNLKPLELPYPEGRIPQFIRSLFKASDGSIYMATGWDGVFRFDGEQTTPARHADGDAANSTFAVFETDDGRIFVGAEQGLRVIEDGHLVTTTYPDPVLPRPIYCIEKDQQGRIWFGTDKGVFIWDGDKLINYSTEDGLIGTEINRSGFHSDSKGQFWVGTDQGVSVYRPDLDVPPHARPTLKVVGFDVDGQWYESGQPLELNEPPRTLEVHFRGISFADEQRAGFRTWLENYETGWNKRSDRPISQIRYTNLPAGHYRFHVQMQNRDGTSSEEIVSQDIHIKPQLLNRWYILLLIIVATAVSGYGLISYWEGRRYARRLEDEVQARTRELEESEHRVKAESQRLATTLSSILDGVLAVNQDNIVVICNPAAEVILDCRASDIIGRSLEKILPIRDEELTEDLHSLPGESNRSLLECPRRGNVFLEFTVSPITDGQGQSTGKVVAFSDITERLRLERDLIRSQKMESLGLLAGGIAHDFNNLLTIILGNLDMLKMFPDELGEHSLENLELAMQASTRARALTEQLVTFARGGTPQRQLSDLQKILQQSIALSFSGLPIKCHLDVQEDLWYAHVDPSQMGQVFNNLLINAVQALGEKGEVRIKARNMAETPTFLMAGSWIRLDFMDNGPGIPDDRLSRIFDPYFTTKSKGSGLGLATVQSIVTRHEGKIQVDSKPGLGTTFTVFLPRGEGSPIDPVPLPEPGVTQGGKVLILEDEAGIRRLLRQFLQRMGMSVVASIEGNQTLAMFRSAYDSEEPFDLVITDLTIPGGLGGRETMARILEIDPDVRGIVISGYSHEDVLANFSRHGYQGALGKPFEYLDLARVVGQVLGDGSKE